MPLSKQALQRLVRRHLWKVITAAAVLLAISFLFNTSIKFLLVMLFFITLGSFSTFYFNYIRPPIHFETVKLGTILVGVAYGVLPAILVGVLSTLIGRVLIGYVDERLPISLLTISGVAIVAALFSATPITVLGIALVGAYNLTMLAISLFLGGNMEWNLPYEGSNFLINLVWFTRLAPLLLPIIQ